jgi:three-Cys-motif partner protein
MPTADTEYELAPDGLAARVVGPWVERKVYYVDRYAAIFANGMKKQWKRRAYVELFAGPGVSYDRGHRQFIDGSALRALGMAFTDWAFVDLDPVASSALDQRIANRGRSGQAKVFKDDCNNVVPRLRAAIPADALTLAFIDPTNWQVKLSTIAALVENRHVDLLMTFHEGSMRRVGHLEDCNLDEFFGTGTWRDALTRPRHQRLDALLGLYNAKLGELNYLPSFNLRVPVKNTKGVVMYDLVLFSRNERGIDFWQKAINGPNESGARGFWDL